MLQFYVVDNLWQGALNTSHFHCLPDAVRAYRTLPAANRKALGIQRGVDAIDLVQCLPLFPNDREGEDVMVLRFLEFPLWKSDPQIMEAAQELASRLHPRYCLYRRCIIPAPERDRLLSTPFKNVIFRRNRMSFFAGQHTGVYSLNYRPTCRLEARQVLIYQCILDLTGENDKYNYSKAAHLYPLLSYSPCSAKNYKIASALTLPRTLRGRYLWPDEPGNFYTAAQWVYVAGVGRLSSIEFKRRYMDVSSVHYPLVVHISACGMDSRGNFHSLQVSPWDFHLLIQRTSSRAAHRSLPG